MEVSNKVKQVLIVRKDLKNTEGHKIRTGKVIAQACHACEAWIFGKMSLTETGPALELKPEGVRGRKDIYVGTLRGIDENIKTWIQQGHKKIVLAIRGEEELEKVYQAAVDAGLIAHMVVDAGLTEFGGVATKTAIAIGPGSAEEIDKITGDLKPY